MVARVSGVCEFRPVPPRRGKLAPGSHPMDTVADIARLHGTELKVFCQRMVYNAALAEEIVQDVMTAYQRRPPLGTDTGRSAPGADVMTGARLRGWLYQVARNRCIDVLRKMRPQERLSAIRSSRATFGKVLVDTLTTPCGRAVKAEQVERAQSALDELEDDLRSVVIMRVYQQLTRKEIAQAVGLSVSGVKFRLALAFKQMRQALADLEDTGA